ncbi:MAG: hypothetical protein WC911_03570 [Thermoleophilia bacterium]
MSLPKGNLAAVVEAAARIPAEKIEDLPTAGGMVSGLFLDCIHCYAGFCGEDIAIVSLSASDSRLEEDMKNDMQSRGYRLTDKERRVRKPDGRMFWDYYFERVSSANANPRIWIPGRS